MKLHETALRWVVETLPRAASATRAPQSTQTALLVVLGSHSPDPRSDRHRDALRAWVWADRGSPGSPALLRDAQRRSESARGHGLGAGHGSAPRRASGWVWVLCSTTMPGAPALGAQRPRTAASASSVVRWVLVWVRSNWSAQMPCVSFAGAMVAGAALQRRFQTWVLLHHTHRPGESPCRPDPPPRRCCRTARASCSAQRSTDHHHCRRCPPSARLETHPEQRCTQSSALHPAPRTQCMTAHKRPSA